MATAADQINRALRLLGILAESESPSDATSQDCLTSLNQMIDSWNTERLSVFATSDQSFTWAANTTTRTIGTTGDFVGTRPILIDPATFFRDSSSIDHRVEIVNRTQYNSISDKTITGPYPEVLFVNMADVNASMSAYPVPSAALTIHIIGVTELTQPSTLTTTLSNPPGYLRAFAYNLAVEMAPEFGVSPSAEVKLVARVSKRNLKRINNPDDVLEMPWPLLANRSRYNIFSGNY